jgi:hypothetical protein
VVSVFGAPEVLSCRQRLEISHHTLVPELANFLPQSAPYCTKPSARSRMQSHESVPFVVISNKEISSCHPEETIRLKSSMSLPSILSDSNRSSLSIDQTKKEEPEDISSEESLLSTPTQSHFELPQTVETPKATSAFSIFSYDVPSSKLDPRRAFSRTQSFRH